jgi:putative transposase
MNRLGSSHRRHSIRLKAHDYASPAAYFLTLCTEQRISLFGEVAEHRMSPNDVGRMVSRWWCEIPQKYPAVRLDFWVVMPNHIHGILVFSNVPPGAEQAPDPTPLIPKSEIPELSHVIRWFKTMTTNEYFREVTSAGWPRVPGKLWQRNYFEHVIRGRRGLENIRRYITENPGRWEVDCENPENPGREQDLILKLVEMDLHSPGW